MAYKKSTTLTPREETVLNRLMAYMSRYGRVPNNLWLAKQLGLSPATIPQYFANLQDKGYIEKAPFDSYVKVLKDSDGSPVRQVVTVRFEPI